MEVYDIIHNIINDSLDSRSISTTEISHQLNETRDKMVYWRNADYINDDILYKVFEYLYSDISSREYVFISEILKSYKLDELKNIYEHIDEIYELKDTIHMNDHHCDIVCKDILRKIVNLEGKKLLRERKYAKDTTLY